MFKKITSENVNIYAIKHYDNPHCENEKEFYDDMKRFKYIKRLLRKYKETNILKERLILNHLISFYNVFDIKAASRMMFYRMDEDLKPALKTFLIFLNYLPQGWFNEIPLDQHIVDVLRKI